MKVISCSDKIVKDILYFKILNQSHALQKSYKEKFAAFIKKFFEKELPSLLEGFLEQFLSDDK